jgi:hypothetical protein
MGIRGVWMSKRCVYIKTNDEFGESRNYSTGTKIYERLRNACNRIGIRDKAYIVEYELVSTGNKYNREGDIIND